MAMPLLPAVRKLLRLIRLTPFDTSTTQGRADERLRRVTISAAASALAKVASSLVILATVPMLIEHLGVERFGIWITITSLPALLSFSDFGIGNGMLTAISRASGRDDQDELRRYVTSGFAATSAIALVLLGAFFVASAFIPWARILNVQTQSAADELGPSIAVLGIGLAMMIPAGVAGRIQAGLQQSFSASLFQIFGSLLTLAGLLVAVWGGAGLAMLIACAVGGPLVAALWNSALFFGKWRPDLRPMARFFSPVALRHVAHLGLLYFILQIALGVGMSTDNIIISHFLGPEAVAQYAVPAKLFGLISIGISMAMNPLWPAYGEASARGDAGWVRRILLRSMALSVIGGLVGLTVLIVAMPAILQLWVGGRISAPLDLMLALAVWTLIECWSGSVAMYLHGTGVVRLQVYAYSAFAVVCFGVRVAFVANLGLPGIPWGAVAAYGITILVPYTVFLRSRLRGGAENG